MPERVSDDEEKPEAKYPRHVELHHIPSDHETGYWETEVRVVASLFDCRAVPGICTLQSEPSGATRSASCIRATSRWSSTGLPQPRSSKPLFLTMVFVSSLFLEVVFHWQRLSSDPVKKLSPYSGPLSASQATLREGCTPLPLSIAFAVSHAKRTVTTLFY